MGREESATSAEGVAETLKRVGLVVAGTLAFLLSALIFLVATDDFDRAAMMTGRSEVINVRVPGGTFASWSFPSAELRSDPGLPVETGRLSIDLAPGASIRFRRQGRGSLEIDFEAPRGAAECAEGGHLVGTGTMAGRDLDLCDLAIARLRLGADAPPLTIAVQGEMIIGEAVRAGSVSQSILLEATVGLLIRPRGRALKLICNIPALETACERYEVAGATLSAGDEAEWRTRHQGAYATGFLRIDDPTSQLGFSFDVSASAEALRVTRLKGESFEVREGVYERVARAPITQAVLTLGGAAFGVASTLATLAGWAAGVISPRRWRWAFGLFMLTLLTALLAMAVLSMASAQQVYLESREEGQAMLLSRGDRCHAVTLEHVAGRPDQEDRSTMATLVGQSRRLGDGSLLRRIPSVPEPLVVFDVSGALAADCPRFIGPSSLDLLLRGAPEGQLRVMRRDGAFTHVPVTVQAVDFEVFLVRIGSAAARGMSGGTVLIGGQPAGLLADVDPDTGVGRVARMDRILERLAPWFLAAGVSATAPASRPGQPGQATATVPLRVERWSVPPARPEERVEALLTGGTWRVQGAGPATAVFALPEGTVLSAVAVSVSGLPDPPRTVEILLSPAGVERWSSAGVASLEPGDTSRQVSFAPRRARLLMLRLTGSIPGETSMALRGISVE